MERRRKLYLGKAAAIMGAIPFLIWAHSSGPDAGKAGVPGESTCAEMGCHVGTPLNGGGGSVSVAFPNGPTYSPGVKQHLKVTITDPTQKVWGFQLTARQTPVTTDAGAFTSTDQFTALVCGTASLDPNQEQFIDFGQNQVCPASTPRTYIEHTKAGSSRIRSGSQTYEFDWTPPATNVGNISIYVAGNAANGNTNETGDHIYTASYTLTPSIAQQFTNTYYFPHLAFGGGFQTTLTYVNYSPLSISCQSTFYADDGTPLLVPFAGGPVSSRSDSLAPGAGIHVQTQAAGGAVTGWAQAQCTGAIKASLLYRLYDAQGVPQGEAAVNSMTTPTTRFVTFAETQTGVAYANPSAAPATITINALGANGLSLGTKSVTLAPNAHGSANIGPLLGISSFTGSVQIVATAPIVSLSLNAEAFTLAHPVFSSLPPGDLPDGTALASGTAGGGAGAASSPSTYYFPHLAFGGGFQTTLTYVNYSPQSVSCQTSFFSDTGTPLPVPFGGTSASTRTDNLAGGADVHVQTQAAGSAITGWAQAQCTGPVKASLLYRLYNAQGAPQGEAAVNSMTTPTTEFVTFAETQTGAAYANPSAAPATVTLAALDANGLSLGSKAVTLAANAHGSANIGPLLGISGFTGSVQITSTAAIVGLSLNAEAFTLEHPVFSSLPPGDLADLTPLAGGH